MCLKKKKKSCQIQILCRWKIIAIATVASVYENGKVKNSHFQHLKLHSDFWWLRAQGGAHAFSMLLHELDPSEMWPNTSLLRWKYMVLSLKMGLITINQTGHFRPPPCYSLFSGSREPKGLVSGILTASNGECFMHPEIFLLVKSSSSMSSLCLGVGGEGRTTGSSTVAGSKNGACFTWRTRSLLFSDRPRWKISKRKKS